jgi:hypothetical protein
MEYKTRIKGWSWKERNGIKLWWRPRPKLSCRANEREKTRIICEISSSHGGEYDVQNCLLGYTAV